MGKRDRGGGKTRAGSAAFPILDEPAVLFDEVALVANQDTGRSTRSVEKPGRGKALDSRVGHLTVIERDSEVVRVRAHPGVQLRPRIPHHPRHWRCPTRALPCGLPDSWPIPAVLWLNRAWVELHSTADPSASPTPGILVLGRRPRALDFPGETQPRARRGQSDQPWGTVPPAPPAAGPRTPPDRASKLTRRESARNGASSFRVHRMA